MDRRVAGTTRTGCGALARPNRTRCVYRGERRKGGRRSMGLYKICDHKGRARDRCDHAWWGSFRGRRVSLEKWANLDIKTKAEAGKALDDLRAAIRAGTFDERGLEPPVEKSPLTFSKFADVYRQRHVLAKRLALAD